MIDLGKRNKIHSSKVFKVKPEVLIQGFGTQHFRKKLQNWYFQVENRIPLAEVPQKSIFFIFLRRTVRKISANY